MRFSIVTPSFRNSEWLKLCIASVADQGVELEHIIQDSCSDDGTQEWLRQDNRVQAFIEKDRGMYDAVNRGFRRASGDVFAYINCDEQYLPGTLARVGEYFQQNPNVEVVFAHCIIVGSEGEYICDRRVSIPTPAYLWVGGNLSVFTAATFYRRSVIQDRQLFFNANHRDVSDAEWVLSLIECRVPMRVLNIFASVFTDTGENMNLRPNAQREKAELYAKAPAWARRLRRFIVARYRLQRLLAGHYRKRSPYMYSVYTKKSPDMRIAIQVLKPTFRWVR